MPQYELMYLLGSHVPDTDVPQIAEQIKKFVEDFGGSDIVEQQLGKKKLAYPIKKTRNGHYVVVNFTMDSQNINQLDARIRSQEASVIRYIIVNLDEHKDRLEKDKVAQAKLSRRPQGEEVSAAERFAPKADKPEKKKEPAPVLEEIDAATLDKKIEEALSEDITK